MKAGADVLKLICINTNYCCALVTIKERQQVSEKAHLLAYVGGRVLADTDKTWVVRWGCI